MCERERALGLVAGYLLLTFLGYTVGGAMALLVPLYAIHLKSTTFQIGMLRGISGLGALLLVIPAGFFIDRFGTKRLYLAGSMAGAAVLFVLPLTETPLVLTALMGAGGLCNALKSSALMASFFCNLPTMGIERAGWHKGAMSIGLSFSGPVLGAYLLKVTDFGDTLRLLAWLAMLPIVLVLFFHKEPVRPSPVFGFRKSIGSELRELCRLLGERSLWLPLMTETISTACFTSFSAFIVLISQRSLHLDPIAASMFLTTEGGVFILTVFAAGPLVSRLSPLRLALTGYWVTVAGLLWLSLCGGFVSAILATVVLGLGLGLNSLIICSEIGRMNGEKGKIVGLFNTAVQSGIFWGPVFGGVIGQFLGTGFIFAAFIPLFIGLALLAMLLDSRRKTCLSGR